MYDVVSPQDSVITKQWQNCVYIKIKHGYPEMKNSEVLMFKACKPISFNTILWFVGFTIKAHHEKLDTLEIPPRISCRK